MSVEIIVSIVASITAIISSGLAAHFKMISDRKTTIEDKKESFLEGLILRVDTLEDRTDVLNQALVDMSHNAEIERRKLIDEYEKKILSVKVEMRRLVDDSILELSMWRDKYYKLLDDYQKIKLEYQELKIHLTDLESEYRNLEIKFQALFNENVHLTNRLDRQLGSEE